MATANTKTTPAVGRHHYIRTTFSSLFGFIALGLIIASILVVWIDRTLTNTDEYVRTVAPLVTKPDVQNFVVDKASDGLLKNKDAPVQDIATQLLGADQVAGKTDDQLRAEITPIVKSSLHTVVASPQFAALWAQSNRDVHSQLISQLNSNSPTIALNFHPLITGVIGELGTTRLGFVKDKLDLKPDAGVVAIQGKQIVTVHKVYNYFKTAMLAIIVLALFAAVLCVLISVHHGKTARRIALATGIYCAFLALALSATSLVKSGGSVAAQQKMAIALVNGVTHDLRLSLIVIAVVCIVGALGSKLYAVKLAPKSSSAKR